MAEEKNFIAANKELLIQEIGITINNINEIMGAVIHQKAGEEAPINFLVALGLQVGAVTVLYNEFCLLESGKVPGTEEEEDEEPKEEEPKRVIGFHSILEKQNSKKKEKK